MNTHKIAIVGDCCVGKTAIVNRFISGEFSEHYQSTVGIDFVSKSVFFDGIQARLQIWDTAGQERFKALVPSYIRGSSAVIIVYDASLPKTAQKVEEWANTVTEVAGGDAVLVVVANKIDKGVMPAEVTVPCTMTATTSAKTGKGVTELFGRITALLEARIEPAKPAVEPHTVVLAKTTLEPAETDGCC